MEPKILGIGDVERCYMLQSKGYDIEKVINRVARLFTMRPEEILRTGKKPERVRARSLVCYWAVNALKINGTEMAKLLGVKQSSISRSLRGGERFTLEKGYRLEE